MAQLIEYDKKFLILGNQGAVCYKSVFPLIKEELIWFGASITSGNREFRIPPHYETDSKSLKVYEDGTRTVRVPGVRWFTNLDNRRSKPELMPFKKYYDDPSAYPKYDNYDAINVDRLVDIPCDYYGVMGVPITYMAKHQPNGEREILHRQSETDPRSQQVRPRVRQGTEEVRPDLHPTFEVIEFVNGGSKDICIGGKHKYGRIMIRRKQ